jgi:hypothetical protein
MCGAILSDIASIRQAVRFLASCPAARRSGFLGSETMHDGAPEKSGPGQGTRMTSPTTVDPMTIDRTTRRSKDHLFDRELELCRRKRAGAHGWAASRRSFCRRPARGASGASERTVDLTRSEADDDRLFPADYPRRACMLVASKESSMSRSLSSPLGRKEIKVNRRS